MYLLNYVCVMSVDDVGMHKQKFDLSFLGVLELRCRVCREQRESYLRLIV